LKNYYDILEVSVNASDEVIRVAYRKLAQKHHPDKNNGDKASEEKFKIIQEAYEVLSNQERRALYDRPFKASYNDSQSTNTEQSYSQSTFSKKKPLSGLAILLLVFAPIIGLIVLGYYFGGREKTEIAAVTIFKPEIENFDFRPQHDSILLGIKMGMSRFELSKLMQLYSKNGVIKLVNSSLLSSKDTILYFADMHFNFNSYFFKDSLYEITLSSVKEDESNYEYELKGKNLFKAYVLKYGEPYEKKNTEYSHMYTWFLNSKQTKFNFTVSAGDEFFHVKRLGTNSKDEIWTSYYLSYEDIELLSSIAKYHQAEETIRTWKEEQKIRAISNKL
jgi:curved DNA-binding protein CbpA